jgi:hypothetical protein
MSGKCALGRAIPTNFEPAIDVDELAALSWPFIH